MPSTILLWSIRAAVLLTLAAGLGLLFGSALRVVWSFMR